MQQDYDTEVLAQATEEQKCHLLRQGRLNNYQAGSGSWMGYITHF